MEALSRTTTRGGGTGQAVLQERLDILALPRARGCLPAKRLLGGSAGGGQRGQDMDPLAAVALMFDQGPSARQGPGIGHGRGQGITAFIQVKELDLPLPGFFFNASNSDRACVTATGSCLGCRLALVRRKVASISCKYRRVDRALSWI